MAPSNNCLSMVSSPNANQNQRQRQDPPPVSNQMVAAVGLEPTTPRL